MNDYLKVFYSGDKKPATDYPQHLADYLTQQYLGPDKGKLLDIGCGKGDLLRAFGVVGFETFGVDGAQSAVELCDPIPVSIGNLETDRLDFEDDTFDVVISKSVVEHLHQPLKLTDEAFRILKPGGTLILLTPSWMHHRFGPFYIDFTHVTPFTAPSLRALFEYSGFSAAKIDHFIQLPYVWHRPWLKRLVRIFARLSLPYSPMYDDLTRIRWPVEFNKLIRFSREVMLLGVATKP